jgi:hypothetical protein
MNILPEDITLRCNDITMVVPNTCVDGSKIIYFDFPLPRDFDIIYSIKSFTNAESIAKIELCFLNGDIHGEKITDIQLNSEIVCPLYFYRYCPLCIKIEYESIIHIPEEIEMIYTTMNLTKYRKDRV